MAKKEEYHNLKDLQSDELNLEKVIEKIREEAKEEEIPERLKPEHLDEILNSQKKKGRWQGMKKRKYMVAAAWVAVLVGIGVSSVVLIHKKDSAEIGQLLRQKTEAETVPFRRKLQQKKSRWKVINLLPAMKKFIRNYL